MCVYILYLLFAVAVSDCIMILMYGYCWTSRNQLSVLPSTLCQLPLEVLLVANNKLVALPEELGRMKTLAELDASCNEISHLPPQLGELPVLKSLSVRRNHIVELPVGK